MASIRSGIGENMEDRYLFRAKRKKYDSNEEVWVIGSYVHTNDGDYIVVPYKKSTLLGEGKYIEVVPETVCQCTGLKDENDKLIYENDIVELLGHRGVIKYVCGGFGIGYRKNIDWEEIQSNIMRVTGCENILYACENDNYISLWEIYWNFNDEDDSVDTVEVIGNVFDNKELLESEEK